MKQLICTVLVIAIMVFPGIQVKALENDSQKRLEEIRNELEQSASKIGHGGEEEEDLNKQLYDLEKDTQEINSLITDSRQNLNQINIQLDSVKINLDKQKSVLKGSLITLQKESSKSFFEVIISGQNIGEILAGNRALSKIQNQVRNQTKDLSLIQAEYDTLNKDQEEIKKILEDSKFLLKSKRDSIEYILQKTEGENQRYKELLKALKEQEIELQSEIEQSKVRDSINYGDEVSDSGSSLGVGCVRVETKSVSIPEGYFRSPAEGWLTQGFHCSHDALDIANGMGTEIKASAEGIVFKKDYMVGGYGNYIVLKHDLPSGDVLYSVYAHLQSQSFLNLGDNVGQGDTIGFMGCTGNTRPRPCGVHLHFAIVSDTNDGIGYIGCLAHAARNCFNPLSSPINIKL